MNKDEIKRKLITLCAGIFEGSNMDSDLFEYVDFADDLGMDSIIFITLIIEIESAFDIIIPDDLLSIDNFRKMNEIVSIISKLINC